MSNLFRKYRNCKTGGLKCWLRLLCCVSVVYVCICSVYLCVVEEIYWAELLIINVISFLNIVTNCSPRKRKQNKSKWIIKLGQQNTVKRRWKKWHKWQDKKLSKYISYLQMVSYYKWICVYGVVEWIGWEQSTLNKNSTIVQSDITQYYLLKLHFAQTS